MAAWRAHELSGNYPFEGEVGQNVRNFNAKRIGDKLDAMSRHVAPAGFPICNNGACNWHSQSIKPSSELLLSNSQMLTDVADASSNGILDFWFHT